MKILLVLNKYIFRDSIPRIDLGYWIFKIPLVDLGHEVYFYDTVNPIEKDFGKIVESFKPDLIFCCMTGNAQMAPYEPWEEIEKETLSGRTKTFNWFCDDTWRFENFTKEVCNKFTVCSTPEPKYVQKYKDIGYSNVIVGPWHSNIDFHPIALQKDLDVSFCGVPNEDRVQYSKLLLNNGINFHYHYGLTHEDMLYSYSRSKIGLNFSKNLNAADKQLQVLRAPGPFRHRDKAQMKARMFEVPASKTLLLTEYTENLEDFFEIDKEIICFDNPSELLAKSKYLLEHPNIMNKITEQGHQRFLKEHESHVRLKKVLQEIKSK